MPSDLLEVEILDSTKATVNGQVVRKPRGDRRRLEQVALDFCSKIAEERKTILLAHATYPDGRQQWVRVAPDGSAQPLAGPPAEYRTGSSTVQTPMPAPRAAHSINPTQPLRHPEKTGGRPFEPRTPPVDHLGIPSAQPSAYSAETATRPQCESAQETHQPPVASQASTNHSEATANPDNSPATRRVLPTTDELLAAADKGRVQPAQYGWRAWLRLPPGHSERERLRDIDAIQVALQGPKNITVVNPKGGVGKTTAVRQLSATLGRRRGGYVLAWDNNPTRGNLGSRTIRPGLTVVELLADLARFENEIGAGVGDLSNFVRSQGDDQFDVLSSSRSTARMKAIDDQAFNRLDDVLDRFYRIKVVDSGNDMTRNNYTAALDRTDQLVIVSCTVKRLHNW